MTPAQGDNIIYTASLNRSYFCNSLAVTNKPKANNTPKKNSEKETTMPKNSFQFRLDSPNQVGNSLDDDESNGERSESFDHQSTIRGSSFHDERQPSEEEKKEIASRESRQVTASKLLVGLVLAASATCAGFFAYKFMRNEEHAEFKRKVREERKRERCNEACFAVEHPASDTTLSRFVNFSSIPTLPRLLHSLRKRLSAHLPILRSLQMKSLLWPGMAARSGRFSHLKTFTSELLTTITSRELSPLSSVLWSQRKIVPPGGIIRS